MSRPAKTALGIATAWGPLYIVFFFVVIGVSFATGRGDRQGEELFIPFGVLFGLHIFTILLAFVLLGVYAVHAYRSERVPENRRTFWAVVLFMGNLFAFPVYFWLYVRPDDPRPEPVRAAGDGG